MWSLEMIMYLTHDNMEIWSMVTNIKMNGTCNILTFSLFSYKTQVYNKNMLVIILITQSSNQLHYALLSLFHHLFLFLDGTFSSRLILALIIFDWFLLVKSKWVWLCGRLLSFSVLTMHDLSAECFFNWDSLHVRLYETLKK